MTTVRLHGMASYGGADLELTALGLRALGADLTTTAITASHAPIAGSLVNLLDSDLQTSCTFAAADAASPGFFIDITVAESAVDGLRLGSGAVQASFVRYLSFGIVEPATGRVLEPVRLDEIDWPGANAALFAVVGDVFFTSVALLLPMHADLLDYSSGAWVMQKQGTGALVADSAAWGGGALALNGATGLYTATTAPWAFLHDNSTPYTVEIDFLYTPSAGGQALVATSITSANIGFFFGLLPSGVPYCTLYKGDSDSVLRADASKAAIAGKYNTLKLTYLLDRALRLELNGETVFSGLWPIESGSWAVFAQGAPTNALAVGMGRANGNWLVFAQGRLCELRITKLARPAGVKTAPFPTTGTSGTHHPAWGTSSHRTVVVPSMVPPLPQGLQGMGGRSAMKLLDVEFGGVGRIYGTVSRKGTPANVPMRRRVRLHRSADGMLVRETWSNDVGVYEFREMNPRYEYDVIAWDHELQEFSTVANNQLAEVMP